MQREDYLKAFGKHLKQIREEKSLSQRDLAFKIGRDKSAYQRVEWGMTNPSLIYLMEIAKGLEISLPELIDFEA